VPRANAEEILRLNPSTQLVVLKGQHLAMHLDPNPLADAIVRFIESAERRMTANFQPGTVAAK
jgi:hypothetical protein